MSERYEIHITYKEDASSYETFKNVASLMLAIDDLNNAIAKSFSEEIETEAVIDEIANGSIRIWLRDKLKSLPDDKLKAYVKEPREAIADLLVTIKRKIVKALDNPEGIESRVPQIVKEEIENSEIKAAGYAVHKAKLLESVGKLSNAAGSFDIPPTLLIEGERMTIVNAYTFDPRDVEGVMMREQHTRGTFVIKKPDLVGESRWTIIFDRNIDVTIADREWLERLHKREISITPGDMLDAELKIETYLDEEDMSVIDTKYYITKVYGIVPPSKPVMRQLIE